MGAKSRHGEREGPQNVGKVLPFPPQQDSNVIHEQPSPPPPVDLSMVARPSFHLERTAQGSKEAPGGETFSTRLQ